VKRDIKDTLGGVFVDQKLIWTSPFRLQAKDMAWLVPDAGIAAGLFATDRTTSRELSRRGVKRAGTFSNAGLAAFAGVAGGMYVLGVHRNDDQMRETGRLSAEAAADAFGVTEVLKYSMRRERPNVDNGRGDFFQSGGVSFPSAHASLSFAIATVVSKEYPGPLTKFFSYGLATAVSAARVSGQQHFLSDVFVGGTTGYLIGSTVYRHHHEPTDVAFGNFEREAGEPLAAARMSSTYIELDSWIYPAVERLAAMGVINTEFAGLRPWTRMAVYQMTLNARDEDLSPEAEELVSSLNAELRREAALDNGASNDAIGIERIYERTQYISGTPLNDSFHFGQTIVNDFGRPYGSGVQQIAGFQAHAEKGRLSFFVRGELQHAPSVPGYSPQLNQTLAAIDTIPGENFAGRAQTDSFRLLDTYASLNLLSNEISVGKQSFWWAPDDSTALMISNNAEPFYGVRINRTLPLRIPLLSSLLGPLRYDNYFGRLGGVQAPARPYTYGQKISFRPTENLELGFSRNAMFAGAGLEPLTVHTFLKSFTSLTSGTEGDVNPRDTPGTRHSNFDFRYRLPFLRQYITLYTDSFVHDDVSPLDAPRRAAVMPGVFISKIPGVPRLDLHIEGGTTDTVTSRAEGGNFYFVERFYKDSYLNKRNLLGSWIGREGTGGQAWATYWLNPQSSVMAGFRSVKVSQFFIPQGESQSDAYAQAHCRWKSGVEAQLLVQRERWFAPLLAATPQHNTTVQFGLSYWPKDWTRERSH
jgi:membrane-associated phospholipid phosphatase